MDKEAIFIAENDRLDTDGVHAGLLKLSELSAPLPIVLKELYPNRRIVFFTTKKMLKDFRNSIMKFSFYDLNIIFCSDEKFNISLEECWMPFHSLEEIEFTANDYFFAFDNECKSSVIDYVKSKRPTIHIEYLSKSCFEFFSFYAINIRPLKNLVARNPQVHVIMTTNFTPPTSSLTEWEQKLRDEDLAREKMVDILKTGAWPYPDGLYSSKYTAEDIIDMQTIPNRTMNEDGVLVLEDKESKYVNVRNGLRHTEYQPNNYERTIHLFGGCSIFGVGHADDETMASQLQLLLNEKAPKEKFLVQNRASFLWGRHDMLWYVLNKVSFKPQDIIVIPSSPKWASMFYKSVPNIHYADLSIRLEEDGEIFNDAWHPSESALRAYARNLFNFLEENNFLEEKAETNELFARIEQPKQWGIPSFANSAVSQDTDLLSKEYMLQLNEYLDQIKKKRPKVGSIVMNCNPFTLGHRYLIECASRQVDHLYIFAVEEDRSFFPFKDRIRLIEEGTRDLGNVTVLPSGNFIISSLTFTDYFGKKELQDKTIDPSLDVSLFGKYIAPALGITVRFAGEEPLDRVTLQYNDSMKKILPEYGIEFVVIPRKESGGQVISASRVRKLLEEQSFKEIKKIVPKTTYKYLLENFKK